jgi:tetratricopeptide (TPR) repeat protein
MLEDRGHGAAARAALGRPAHPEDSSDPPPVLPQSRDPGDLLGFAEKRIEAGDVSGAVAALERAETLGLRGADQLSRAGFVLLQARRFADAEKRLDVAASDAASASRYRSLAGRGAARYRLGRREEGLRDVASAKSLRPDDPLPYLLLALAYRDVEDAAAARREAEEGLRRSPGDARLIRLLESLPAAR